MNFSEVKLEDFQMNQLDEFAKMAVDSFFENNPLMMMGLMSRSDEEDSVRKLIGFFMQAEK